MKIKFHTPVMYEEILNYLNLSPGKIIVDATVGTGGHSQGILQRISPGGRLIGLDRDEESLDVCRRRLEDFGSSATFIQANFTDIETALKNLGIKKIDGIVFDLGVSSFQMDNPERGFSFQNDGPLDMRLDRKSFISAYDLVNNLDQEGISSLLWNFGQERWHNRIARFIVDEREKEPIATTAQLSSIVIKAIPYRYRHRYSRIHPATRTFQAVRIAVNQELEALESALNRAVELLNRKARICIISFHSLEDRIAKLTLRRFKQQGLVELITPKPLTPSEQEIKMNPSSRSAKLRVAERIK